MSTFTLEPYQKIAVNSCLRILRTYSIVILAMEMRTRKTATSLTMARDYGVKSVLFITPKVAIKDIQDQYVKLGYDYDLTVTNYASAHKITGKFDLIILDESHMLGAFPKKAQRVDKVKAIARNTPIIYLTATPSPESYSQMFHQLSVSSYSPFREYATFYKWANDYVIVTKKRIGAREINDYSKVREDRFKSKVNHLIYSLTQKEAGFQSLSQTKIKTVPLDEGIKMLMFKLKKEGIVKHYDKVATVKGGADLINKLSQLSSGTLKFDDEENGTVLSTNKAEYIREEFGGQKIAIYYYYKAEFEVLKSVFPNWTDDPDAFRDNDGIVFLGQFKSKSKGVDLSSADALICYNVPFSYELNYQTSARIQTFTRTKPSTMYYLFSEGGIESKVYKAVKSKRNFTSSYYRDVQRTETKERKQSIKATNMSAMQMANLFK